jgi:hypothetical protein
VSGYDVCMDDSTHHREDGPPPSAPALPDIDSPPPEAVLEDVPSPEEIIERAESAEDIVKQQPDVDELLRRYG